MKRFRTALLTLVAVIAMSIPASAATCSDFVAIARLQGSGAGTATGQALVFYGGTTQVATIDSDIVGPLVEQTWHLSTGDVEVTESPDPVFLKGPWQRIDSDVVVESPNSGEWQYDGLFNENTLRATFVVTGELCVS